MSSSSLAQTDALAKLLIEKVIITRQEFLRLGYFSYRDDFAHIQLMS